MDDGFDQALLARYRNGDPDAFAEIVIRYQRPIYNAAFWMLRNAEDARDIAQVVFMKVIERLDEYDSHYRFFSWIYRIAVNESINLLRRNGREEELDDETELAGADSANPEVQFSDAERSRHIHQALLSMSTHDRTVLMLRHFSECSYQEIAEILDLDEKTVKSRLYEARHRLGGMLKDLRP
ncbi:MAG: sigma-70 family RNA polymerase sigma factor [Betaproteobacteria bacterium]